VFRARDRSLAAATLVSLFAAVGCPVFLSDDFQTIPTVPSDGGKVPDEGSGGEGGTSGSGGVATGGTSGLPAAGSAGMVETGGATETGGRTFADAAAGGVASGSGGFDAGMSAGGAPADGGDGGFAGAGGTCTGCDPRWIPTAVPDPAFAAREQPAYAAADTRVFIWGGADRTGAELQTGAIYDAELDRWTTVPIDANTPSARVLSTAVWTGTVFVVWGGGDQEALTDYATGGRYDPTSHTWSPMSKNGAPSARRAPYGVWTGSRVLFWGGMSAARAPVGGAYSYDPDTDTWTQASVTGEPPPALDTTVGWTGSALLVYGGRTGATYTARTDGYDASKDLWTSYAAGPAARAGALGTWDGVSFVVWGGTAAAIRKDGQRFSASKWTNLPNQNAPAARYAVHRETGWSARIGDETTLMVGGYDASQTPFTDGTYFRSKANEWNAVGTWPSGSAHLWGVGVWAGASFVLWGGRVGPLGALTTQGERFRL
jgi:hypothetical protein